MQEKLPRLLKPFHIVPDVRNQSHLRLFSTQTKPQRLSWVPLKNRMDSSEPTDSFDVFKKIFPKKENALFKDNVSLFKMMLHWQPSAGLLTFLFSISPAIAYKKFEKFLTNNLDTVEQFISSEYSPYFITVMSSSSTLLYLSSIYFVINKLNKPDISFPGLKFEPFYQGQFDKLILSKIPEAHFKKGGNCYGHVNTWYQFYLDGLNYIGQLNSISIALRSKQKLTLAQKDILESISARQNNQNGDDKQDPACIYSIFFSSVLRTKRQEIISNLIEKSLENPKSLFALFIGSIRSSHVISVVSDKVGTIEIFDPNYGLAICTEKNSAKIYLSKLIAELYGPSLPHLMASASYDDYRLRSENTIIHNERTYSP